jgi:hypothetical protein
MLQHRCDETNGGVSLSWKYGRRLQEMTIRGTIKNVWNWWSDDPETRAWRAAQKIPLDPDNEARKNAKQLALREEWERNGRAAAEEQFQRNKVLAEPEQLPCRQTSPINPYIQATAAPGPVSYIYIIRNVETGRYKIGKANNVSSRFRQLSTASSERLVLVCNRAVPEKKVFRIEKRIHKTLAKHRRNGEWFACNEATVIDAMESVIATITLP